MLSDIERVGPPAAARVIVCEKTGQWAAGLRRVCRDLPCRIAETRSYKACWSELERNPTSFVALEFAPARLAEVLRRLLDLHGRFRHARALILAQQASRRYEWVLREAGAVHVLFTPQGLPSAARFIARHIQLAARDRADTCEWIWQRLPLGSTNQQLPREPSPPR